MSLSVEPARRARDVVALDPLRLALASVTSVDGAKDVRDKAESLRAHAKRIGESLALQNACAEVKVRAERRAGELLDGESGYGRGKKSVTVTDFGITENQATRWQRIAGVASETFETYIAAAKASADKELTSADVLRLSRGADLAVVMSSETPEWYTPLPLIERVIAVLGAIDLDPCSNTGEPRVAAAQHYTEADDGLSQPWRGRVYMNPPYGSAIGQWVDKLAEEFDYGNVSEAIALVPARTDTSWWAHLPASMVCFVTGRLSFSDHDNPAPFPSAVCYLGQNATKFAEEFITLGLIYVRLEVAA